MLCITVNKLVFCLHFKNKNPRWLRIYQIRILFICFRLQNYEGLIIKYLLRKLIANFICFEFQKYEDSVAQMTSNV